MRKKFSKLATFVCLPLLACGGNSNNKTVMIVDGKVFKDAPPALCGAGSSYASLGNSGYALDLPAHTGSDGSAVSRAVLAATTLGSGDVASGLLLVANSGVFTGGDLKPGTYAIAGDEASFGTCSMCFFIQAGAVNNAAGTIGFKFDGTGGDFYQAVSGSLTFTAIGSNAGSGSGHNLVGSVSNAVLQKIDVTTGDPTPDNCMATIGSGGWGYNLQNNGSAAAAAPKQDGYEARLSNRTL
jgi:hypothetical protein